MSVAAPDELPASLQAALASVPVEPKPWDKGVAPAYITLFLTIVYLDQLPMRTLAVGGLRPAVLGAAIAGVLAYVLLYYVPAMWGLKARRPLDVVAASTFGARGATWVPGGLMVVAQVVWFAIAIYYATDVAMRGLAGLRLLDPRSLEPARRDGLTFVSPLFMAIVVAWSISSAVIGTLAVRLTAALMSAYAVFPALVIGGLAAWAMPGLPGFRPLEFDPLVVQPVGNPSGYTLGLMIQLVFAFCAAHGAAAADWGAASRDARDVRLGGMVGVAFGSIILAILSLLIVAGALGRSPAPPELAVQLEKQESLRLAFARQTEQSPRLRVLRREVRLIGGADFTIRGILQYGIAGKTGATGLLIMGLALLGPACFAPFAIGRKMAVAWPVLPRWAWSMVGALLTWPLIALNVPARLETLFTILGAAFAPVVGAMAAEFTRTRGVWPGPRRGWNSAGWIAWSIGIGVGLLPLIGRVAGLGAWSQAQPAAVFAFATAFVAYHVLALSGLEPTVIQLHTEPSESVP